MTSQQLRARFDEAVSIIGECERLLEDPDAAARGWDIVCLQFRVRGFMDLYRDALREGGPA
jgi:hypothetical protein